MTITAFITGATSGIGRAMAVKLSDTGYDVYAVGRNRAALEELRASRPAITPIAVDVTDRSALEALVKDLRIDVLINNAGMMPPLGNFADMEIADIEATLAVNLGAVILLIRLVVPQMRDRSAGHILFTGSSAGHAAFANIAVYSATKAAIAGVRRCFAGGSLAIRNPRDGDSSRAGRDAALQRHSRRQGSCRDVCR